MNLILRLFCCRLKAPFVPDVSLFASVVGNAFAIAVVVYAFTISLVKMFAGKHGYNIDSNQVKSPIVLVCYWDK